ncbi:MAG: hypothetical protein WB611_31985 [Stellaceae bacterium]
MPGAIAKIPGLFPVAREFAATATADFCERTAEHQEDTIGIAPIASRAAVLISRIGTGLLRFRWKGHLRAKSDQSQVFAIVWRVATA